MASPGGVRPLRGQSGHQPLRHLRARSPAAARAEPGGALRRPALHPVDAETVDSFEVGAKTALMGRKLYLDAALFFTSTRTSRRSSRSARPSSSPMPARRATAGSAGPLRSQPRAAAVRQLRLQPRASKAAFLDGNRFRLAPGAHHFRRLDLGGGRRPRPPRFHAGGDLPIEGLLRRQQRHPGVAAAASHLAARLRPGRVSGRLCFGQRPARLRLSGGKYRAELFVENLFDKEYIKDAGNSGDALGLPTFIAGEPRTYGIQLTARF